MRNAILESYPNARIVGGHPHISDGCIGELRA